MERSSELAAPIQADASNEVWNLQELLDRLENDESFLRDLLCVFRADSQIQMQKTSAALAAHDFPALTRSAHTLKGMLRNLSMTRAGNLASQLETAARREQLEQAKELHNQLEQAFAELSPVVEAHLAEVKT